MTSQKIRNEIKDYEDKGHKIYGFYVTYNIDENMTCNDFGKIDKFESVLARIESYDMCIQGELPIEQLIFYSTYSEYKLNWQCLVFVKNPLYDCVNDASEDSHVQVVVPYIAENGWFGEIVPEHQIKII